MQQHAGNHSAAAHAGRHEGHSAADFLRRLWVSVGLTVPVILLSPELPFTAGNRLIDASGADWILLGLSGILYVYGGKPFLVGMVARAASAPARHDDACRRRSQRRLLLQRGDGARP